MNNIKFMYLYRDGSNFKKWSNVVFSNPQGLTPRVITKAVRDAWGEDGLFFARQIRIPEVFLYSDSHPNADDHCFHEFHAVTFTSESPNDRFKRSIGKFIAEIQSERNRRWYVFDPFEWDLLGHSLRT